MTREELVCIWNYYLSLESDLSNTSRYIEPLGQENVHSFEFAKLIILACTEVETVFKAICIEIGEKKECGNIGEYKQVILAHYPRIVEAKVTISRVGRDISPFGGWDTGKLLWWDAYTNVKHNMGVFFNDATYLNAVHAISALYVLIFYLAKVTGICFPDFQAQYIDSRYATPSLFCDPEKELPDFEEVITNETAI